MSKLLIAESPLQVLPSLVKALGGSKYLLDAMFLQQIQFWLSNPKMGVDIDGEKFVSFTYEEWHKQFSWVEVDTLRALVARNKEKRLIHVGQYSENPMDKTNYYRINYDVLDELLNVDNPLVEEDTHTPVEGGDERTSSGGVSTISQRINTKKDDSSNSKHAKPDAVDMELSKLPAKSIRDAIKDYFKLNTKWDVKYNREWMEWAVGENITAEQIKLAADKWRTDKQFNWQVPTLKGIFEKWDLLMDSGNPETSPTVVNDGDVTITY